MSENGLHTHEMKTAVQILFLPITIWYYFLIKLLSLGKIHFIEITLTGKMDESPITSGIMNLVRPPVNRFYLKVIELIILNDALSLKKLKAKKKPKEILIIIHDLKIGWAKAWELNSLIRSLNEKIKVKVFLESGDALAYFVALGAEEIYAPPAMSLMLTGLESNAMFYAGLLGKLNIKPNFLKVGDYKSAGEKYTRKNFSEYNRKQLTEILKDFHKEIQKNIHESRGDKLKKKLFKSLDKKALFSSEEAFQSGLLDGVLYLNDIKLLMKEEHQLEPKNIFSSMDKTISKIHKKQKKLVAFKKKKKKIAFVVGEGVILDSDHPNPKAISYSDYKSSFKQLQKKGSYDGFIFRWNSPGGSALVSDLLWSELMKIKLAHKSEKEIIKSDPWRYFTDEHKKILNQKNKKDEKNLQKKNKKKNKDKDKDKDKEEPPILVSQSDVAASGGYFLSAISQEVYCSPLTITGSIGVIMGKFNVAGGLKKFGINVDTVKAGEHSDIFSAFANFSPQQAKLVQENMNSMYELFVDRIHQGRSMPTKTIKKLGGGRVYSGKKAKEIGLVDQIGGLKEVFNDMRKKLDLTDDDEMIIDFFPKIKAPFTQKLSQLPGFTSLLDLTSLTGSTNLFHGQGLHHIKTIEFLLKEKILYLAPFVF